MKKLFISQPMRDKSDKEILKARETAVGFAKAILAEDVEVIDSFFQRAPEDAKPLWYLGESLKLLANAFRNISNYGRSFRCGNYWFRVRVFK